MSPYCSASLYTRILHKAEILIYIQANEQAGLSPGTFTQKYADKQMKRRRKAQEKSALPSTKRRRLILKQERAITQAATETLEGQWYASGTWV